MNGFAKVDERKQMDKAKRSPYFFTTNSSNLALFSNAHKVHKNKNYYSQIAPTVRSSLEFQNI